MIVYRLVITRFAGDLSGEGPRLFGGRWNHKDTSCIYAAENRSLAILEYSVNTSEDDIPRALSMVSIDIPENGILEIPIHQLPGDWHNTPVPPSTKTFGTKLLEQLRSPVIKIPSAVIPEEYNYILNPKHPDAALFKIVEIRDFVYDIRIKLK